jgi:hypothetical protein
MDGDFRMMKSLFLITRETASLFSPVELLPSAKEATPFLVWFVPQRRVRRDLQQAGHDLLGVENLDDIAKDEVTHSDCRAENRGQKKVQTADDH